MIEIIRNTLEIIGKISHSTAGYLLRFNFDHCEVASSFGGSGDIFDPLKDSFIELQKSGNFEKDVIYNLSQFKNLIESHSWNSFFIWEFKFEQNHNNSYYLFLFATAKDNFEEADISTISTLLHNLNNLLKRHVAFEYEVKTENSKLSNDSAYQDGVKESQLLKTIFEASEDLVFILDKYGRIKSVNEYGAAGLDYEPKELLGIHFIELVASKNKEVMAKSFQKIIENDNLVSFEGILLSKFGNEIIFQINCKQLKNGVEANGVLGIGKNITELRSYIERISELNLRLIEANRIMLIEKQRSKRQKAILTELNRMKSEFVSNISHELRTPLASIIGFSETISSDPDMPAEMKNEFNEIILTEGKRLAKLVNDVLDISRLEDGQIELNKTEFVVNKLLEEAIDANQKMMDTKEITLTKEIPPEPAIIKADKEKIFRVFTSLINNAVKFTPPKGRVTIKAQSLYKEYEITITDTGAGIPEKDLPYLFQKFYRVSRPGTEIPGTGLGLVFVKQIVDLHKGFITIQSEVNKGTSVILKLPKDSKV